MYFSDSVTYIFPPTAQWGTWRDPSEWVHRDLFCPLRWAIKIQHRLWQQHELHVLNLPRREAIWGVRSEAIPERRHNSGGRLWPKLFLLLGRASSQEAGMAGGCSSNTANRANYHRESEIGKVITKFKKKMIVFKNPKLFGKSKQILNIFQQNRSKNPNEYLKIQAFFLYVYDVMHNKHY